MVLMALAVSTPREPLNIQSPLARSAITSNAGGAITTICGPRIRRQLNESTRRVHLQDEAFLGLAFPPTIDDARDFYARVKGSNHTRHRVHKMLRAAFQVAVDEQQIPLNPAEFNGKPKKVKSSRVVAFEPEHERRLIGHSVGTEWEAVVLFMLDAGVRQGELLGVQVRDVNFERGEVDLARSVDTVAGVATLKNALKTNSSVRTIRLSDTTLRALRRVVSQKNGPYAHVFTDSKDALWTRTRFYTAWVKLLAEAGIPHYGPHATRHTMATRLLPAGCFLPAVSRRLGHACTSITLDIYAHCLPSDQGALADSFDGFAASLVATGQTKATEAA